jgi:hypothetical protein
LAGTAHFLKGLLKDHGMDYFLKLFLSGTAKGSIYALIALGYLIAFMQRK